VSTNSEVAHTASARYVTPDIYVTLTGDIEAQSAIAYALDEDLYAGQVKKAETPEYLARSFGFIFIMLLFFTLVLGSFVWAKYCQDVAQNIPHDPNLDELTVVFHYFGGTAAVLGFVSRISDALAKRRRQSVDGLIAHDRALLASDRVLKVHRQIVLGFLIRARRLKLPLTSDDADEAKMLAHYFSRHYNEILEVHALGLHLDQCGRDLPPAKRREIRLLLREVGIQIAVAEAALYWETFGPEIRAQLAARRERILEAILRADVLLQLARKGSVD
jgi:hypothetical protein